MINFERARAWLGRVDIREDVAAPSALATLYDLIEAPEQPPDIGAEAPPLAHWLYFSSWSRLADANESGDYRDPSLPPIELPRQVCVDYRIALHRPIRVGAAISRVARVVDLVAQSGSEGPVVTLLLRFEISDHRGVAVSEERRLLYMSRQERWPARGPSRAPSAAEWTHDFRPTTRSLFRYAALTHNMNRIHYDRPFATFVERHPGLVVQNELVSALLLDLARRRIDGARIARVELKPLRWLYDTAPLRLNGCWRSPQEIAIWADDPKGNLAIEGLVTLAAPLAPRP